MSYTVSFISLGCAKNQVNCEQMMATCQKAGYTIQAAPEGADVVVVNTCGFLSSACEEAIDNILEMAELKKAGQVKKILVTGQEHTVPEGRTRIKVGEQIGVQGDDVGHGHEGGKTGQDLRADSGAVFL